MCFSTRRGTSWTTTVSGGAAATSSPARAAMRGWVIRSRSRRPEPSANTMAPSAARSREPSAASTCGPNRSTTAARPSEPGATTSRARRSLSTTSAPSSRSRSATVDLPDPIPPERPTRSMAPTLPSGPASVVGQPGGEATRGHRAPAVRGDAQQALALAVHRGAVVVPVRVLAGDGAVVVDEGLQRLGHVEHLDLAVDLDPGTTEVIRQHHHAGPRVPSRVRGLGALGVGGDDDAALRVHPARDRRELGLTVVAAGDQHHLVPRPDELQQPVEVDPGVRRDGAWHVRTLPGLGGVARCWPAPRARWAARGAGPGDGPPSGARRAHP